MFGIIKRILRRKVKTMVVNKDEPLYGDDRCPACGGEIVKVRGGRNPVFACFDCGRRA